MDPPSSQILKFDLVTELTEFGRSEWRDTSCLVIVEIDFTCWATVRLDNLLGHFSVRFVLNSVYSVSNSCF